jgi:hypothetical protein
MQIASQRRQSPLMLLPIPEGPGRPPRGQRRVRQADRADAAPAFVRSNRFISVFVMAGGTGIEPASCGFGDPIRRVGEYQAVSPHAALPHSRCRLVPPNVAACRRSLGQILGHPLCFRGRSSPCSEDTIRGRTCLMYGLVRRLPFAEIRHSDFVKMTLTERLKSASTTQHLEGCNLTSYTSVDGMIYLGP